MRKHLTEPASQQPFSEIDEENTFSQYLSLRYYTENLNHFTDRTKESINNFLKSVSEIEDEFINNLRTQRMKNLGLHDFGFDNHASGYMEENY